MMATFASVSGPVLLISALTLGFNQFWSGVPTRTPLLSPDALIREATAALARGELEEALQKYDQAESQTTDPGMVTLARAAVHFQLGQWDKAVQLYGYCTGREDPRRPQALLGLANSHLQAALENPETPNRQRLRLALSAYNRLFNLRNPNGLATEARSLAQKNRLRTQLLLAQLGDTPRKNQDAANANEDPSKDPTESEPNNERPGQENKEGKQVSTPGSLDQEKTGVDAKTKATTQQGSSPLPPVPVTPSEPPLSADQAREHLRRATEKILEARTNHRNQRVLPPREGVRDW